MAVGTVAILNGKIVGGGGETYTETLLFNSSEGATNFTLNYPITDFDAIAFTQHADNEHTTQGDYKKSHGTTIIPSSILIENKQCCLYGWDARYRNFNITDNKSFTSNDGNSLNVCKVIGIKYGSISGGSSYTLPVASETQLGGVKIDNDTITIDEEGVIKAEGGSSYTLPPATTSTLGGVIPDGSSITVTSTGVISAVGGGSGGGSTFDKIEFDFITPTNGATEDYIIPYSVYSGNKTWVFDAYCKIPEVDGGDMVCEWYNDHGTMSVLATRDHTPTLGETGFKSFSFGNFDGGKMKFSFKSNASNTASKETKAYIYLI